MTSCLVVIPLPHVNVSVTFRVAIGTDVISVYLSDVLFVTVNLRGHIIPVM